MTILEHGYLISKQKLTQLSSQQLICIESLEQLPEQGCLFVVIDFDNTTDAKILSQLRSIPNYQLTPVFYLGNVIEYHEQLLDGAFDSKSLVLSRSINERMSLINYKSSNELNDFEQLITRYMFVRKGFILKGYLDYKSISGFKYPLLDALGIHEDHQYSWNRLEGMEASKLLQHETLVDEIQSCIHCKSGLLNFKNCCPNCQSIHIVTQSFVHCFACGNIGPLSEFLRHGELSCTRCQARLRHIGIDYDKPLEDKVCRDCQHTFFEASVNAICMVCEKLSDPSELHAKRLYNYLLTQRGESLAKGLDQHLIVEPSQFLKLIDLSIFLMIVTWQTKLAKRYEQLTYSLFAINIINEDELVSKLGWFKTEKLFMEFFDRVRSLLRDSDLVTLDNKIIIFFLPMTPQQGCDIIYERIKAFAEAHSDNKICLRVGIMPSDDVLEKNISSDLLLAELYNRINDDD